MVTIIWDHLVGAGIKACSSPGNIAASTHFLISYIIPCYAAKIYPYGVVFCVPCTLICPYFTLCPIFFMNHIAFVQVLSSSPLCIILPSTQPSCHLRECPCFLTSFGFSVLSWYCSGKPFLTLLSFCSVFL